MGLGQIEGGIKLVADRKSGKVLGVHIVGYRATELIADAMTWSGFGPRVYSSAGVRAGCCHALVRWRSQVDQMQGTERNYDFSRALETSR